MELRDVAALVTGGGSGLGAATARALAAGGAKVAVLDRNADAAHAVAAEIGGLGLACDVTSEASVDEALAKAQALLARGKSPEEVLAFLANTLTNKLLHAPSANLRAAALRGDEELLRAAERLFDAAAHADERER